MLKPGPLPRVTCGLCFRDVAARNDGHPREHSCVHGQTCKGLPVTAASCSACTILRAVYLTAVRRERHDG